MVQRHLREKEREKLRQQKEQEQELRRIAKYLAYIVKAEFWGKIEQLILLQHKVKLFSFKKKER
jgi:hypothetical protein